MVCRTVEVNAASVRFLSYVLPALVRDDIALSWCMLMSVMAFVFVRLFCKIFPLNPDNVRIAEMISSSLIAANVSHLRSLARSVWHVETLPATLFTNFCTALLDTSSKSPSFTCTMLPPREGVLAYCPENCCSRLFPSSSCCFCASFSCFFFFCR